ncbi:prolyl-tRNA synthetase [Paenibacillus turicensis]|uniref:Proline--tRNA ligase n=1 Tax=Paenibacillus turicensis TaxID=160487 RepID=A0ABS4FR32_9BACL|nr:proline--tRNA ligase [Paenibacillus turicensis]MBP1905043.1 prolyl-tRNA synthetase [Paenibacillus turicensis]
MKQRHFVMPTLRETPTEAETASHQLLLRAGFIRGLAAGVYSYLPLAYRVLNNIITIITKELDKVGAQQTLMPVMQPTDLFHNSGRYSVYGSELITFKDRHERDFTLGPTHEEVITTLIQNEFSSYRQFPFTIYQIGNKYRDEKRPRSGLLRVREFIMMDAYSFHTEWESLNTFYEQIHQAYNNIFNRCGLNFRSVEADAGAMGGEGGSHEFMALSPVGEDIIAISEDGTFASNIEKAEVRLGSEHKPPIHDPNLNIEKFHTPSLHSITQLTEALDEPASSFIKTLIYVADDKPVAVLIRGDREVNEIKVQNSLCCTSLLLADENIVKEVTGAPVGFAGPVGLSIPLLVDQEILTMSNAITGANECDYHLRYVKPGIDFVVQQIGDFRNVVQGDLSPHSDSKLRLERGIEIGHIFKLGDKYSKAFDATVMDAEGQRKHLIMGCYGIGVSRLIAAIVEQAHDEHGIIWPAAIAPFQIHIIPISIKDEAQMKVAEQLYDQLQVRGIETLLDDRDERPGIKFKDADLIGIPVQVIVGKGITNEVAYVEVKERSSHIKHNISLDQAIDYATSLLKKS